MKAASAVVVVTVTCVRPRRNRPVFPARTDAPFPAAGTARAAWQSSATTSDVHQQGSADRTENGSGRHRRRPPATADKWRRSPGAKICSPVSVGECMRPIDRAQCLRRATHRRPTAGNSRQTAGNLER